MESGQRTTSALIGKHICFLDNIIHCSERKENPQQTTHQEFSIKMNALLDPLPDPPKTLSKERSPISYFEEPKADTVKDRQQRGTAALLTRFKYLVDLAATPVEDGATKEVAAANAFRMEVESSALVCFPWVLPDSKC
jgi:hypothetical protein